MKKTILAAMCVAAIGATPFAAMAQTLAQTTAPSGQDSTRTGTGTMQKNENARQSGTQGMAKDSMKKDGMHKSDMHKDNMKKDNNMMKKN